MSQYYVPTAGVERDIYLKKQKTKQKKSNKNINGSYC